MSFFPLFFLCHLSPLVFFPALLNLSFLCSVRGVFRLVLSLPLTSLFFFHFRLRCLLSLFLLILSMSTCLPRCILCPDLAFFFPWLFHSLHRVLWLLPLFHCPLGPFFSSLYSLFLYLLFCFPLFRSAQGVIRPLVSFPITRFCFTCTLFSLYSCVFLLMLLPLPILLPVITLCFDVVFTFFTLSFIPFIRYYIFFPSFTASQVSFCFSSPYSLSLHLLLMCFPLFSVQGVVCLSFLSLTSFFSFPPTIAFFTSLFYSSC